MEPTSPSPMQHDNTASNHHDRNDQLHAPAPDTRTAPPPYLTSPLSSLNDIRRHLLALGNRAGLIATELACLRHTYAPILAKLRADRPLRAAQTSTRRIETLLSSLADRVDDAHADAIADNIGLEA